MTKIRSIGMILLLLTNSAWAMSKKAPTPPPVNDPGMSAAAKLDTTWVGKSDLAKSCEKTRGVSIDIMSDELSKAGIKTYAKRKLHDGMMRIQMCGADKGDMNGFLIEKKDLDAAKALGFTPAPAPPQE